MSADRPKFSKAEEIFMRASVQCPASVTAQSAFIAQECKENNLNPTDFRYLPLEDHQVLVRLTNAANKAHQHLPKERFQLVDAEQIVFIFKHDFKLAQDFLALRKEDLEYVYKIMYKEFIGGSEELFELKVRNTFGLSPKGFDLDSPDSEL